MQGYQAYYGSVRCGPVFLDKDDAKASLASYDPSDGVRLAEVEVRLSGDKADRLKSAIRKLLAAYIQVSEDDSPEIKELLLSIGL